MKYKDNIEWLKSLKRQIGQTQHRDLWHFEQVIDETIENLKLLTKPHGRLIDADALLRVIEENSYRLRGVTNSTENGMFLTGICQAIDESPTIIEAEVSE